MSGYSISVEEFLTMPVNEFQDIMLTISGETTLVLSEKNPYIEVMYTDGRYTIKHNGCKDDLIRAIEERLFREAPDSPGPQFYINPYVRTG